MATDSTACRPLRTKVASDAACPDAEFRVGNYEITYSLGCLRKTRTASPIPDGWYNRVRILDGQIVEVDNEEASTTLLPDMCIGTGASGRDLEAPQIQCNLTQISSGQVLTRLQLATPMPSDAFWLEGCGTDGSPLDVKVNPSKLQELIGISGGATTSTCGMEITNGIVTKFSGRFLTGVVNNAVGVLEVSIDSECRLVISVPGYDSSTGASQAVYQATRPCSAGSGSITFGVYAGEQGRFYLRVVAGGPNFSPAAPPFFGSLAEAQQFISTATGVCIAGGDVTTPGSEA